MNFLQKAVKRQCCGKTVRSGHVIASEAKQSRHSRGNGNPGRAHNRNRLKSRCHGTIVLLRVARRPLPPGAEGARGSEVATWMIAKV